MTLRVVVISSVAERSLLQYVNQHVCAISSTTFLFCVFLLSRTDFLPVCKKDRGLRSGCDDTWEAVLISKPIPNPCFQTSGCRVQGCGAVHKNIEAPQNFDDASRRRHLERSREISTAVRESACMRHFINDVFVLRLSAISH